MYTQRVLHDWWAVAVEVLEQVRCSEMIDVYDDMKKYTDGHGAGPDTAVRSGRTASIKSVINNEWHPRTGMESS